MTPRGNGSNGISRILNIAILCCIPRFCLAITVSGEHIVLVNSIYNGQQIDVLVVENVTYVSTRNLWFNDAFGGQRNSAVTISSANEITGLFTVDDPFSHTNGANAFYSVPREISFIANGDINIYGPIVLANSTINVSSPGDVIIEISHVKYNCSSDEPGCTYLSSLPINLNIESGGTTTLTISNCANADCDYRLEPGPAPINVSITSPHVARANTVNNGTLTIINDNPFSNDDDDDSYLDDVDNCQFIPNDQSDLDSDGLGNECDNDIDGDSVENEDDAFPLDPNETSDSDDDGYGDNSDNCPDVANDQIDTDGDHVGDDCDVDDDGDGVYDIDDPFPLDPGESADSDHDGYGDNSDNCPSVNNDQHDADGDGTGDACDPDYIVDEPVSDDESSFELLLIIIKSISESQSQHP